MPIKPPRADQSQADFMQECMHELAQSDTERDQEQMVAICLNAWREGQKSVNRVQADDPENAPYGADTPYADPGYQEDGKARYPIDTEQHIRAAWNYIARKDNQAPYTFDQVKKIKQRIVAAWRKKIDEDGPPGLEDDEHLGKSNKQVNNEDIDVPTPEEDETHEDFLDRCLDEVMDQDVGEEHANSLCALSWENRSAAGRMRQKTHAGEVNNMEFCLSDESVDRMGDVIAASGWQIQSFLKNPIALFNHIASFPVGVWQDLRVEDKELRGRLKLAPAGTSERIDEIRKLVDAGILKAVSVGFRPIESRPRKHGDKYVGEYFMKQELIETSLVSVPANPNALAIAKGLDISDATLDLVFAKHGKEHQTTKRRVIPIGKHAAKTERTKEGDMSLAQRITEAEARIVALKDKLTDHLASVDDSNVSDAQMEATKDLREKLVQEQKQHAELIESEKLLFGEKENERSIVVRNQNGNGTSSVSRPYVAPSRSPNIPSKREDRLDLVVRAGVIQAFAHIRKLPIEGARLALVNAGYSQYADDLTKGFTEYLARAEAAPAMTTVVGWAAELAQLIHADYLDLLYAKAVFPLLAARGLRLNFGRAGRISVPTRERVPSIAGSFVGEGMPIPVRQAAFRAEILVPKKLAVITTFTREMSESSIPAIEGLLRSAIQEDTAAVLDNVLLDNVAADTIRPAGLRFGITPLTPTAGGGFNALVGDLKLLVGELLTSTLGNVRDLVLLMNPQQVLSASLTALPGVSAFPFMEGLAGGRLLGHTVIESGSVPLGVIIAVDASDFVVVGGDAPRFEVSDSATLHMEDTNPLPVVNGGGAVAQPVRSLWQTDSLGLRLILPTNWTMRRAGMVAAIGPVTW